MLRIYLARHGQDRDNANGILNGRRDEPLTEIGLAQAHESAEKIAALGIKFDQIYSSPLQRAYVTAAIIATRLGLPVPEKLDDLIERDFGVTTGTSVKGIEARFAPDILKADTITYALSLEGAETFPQLVERGRRLITWLKLTHHDGNILLVSHGDFGKMIYAAYYGLDWREVLKMFHFGNSELLLLAPDSLSEDVHVFRVKQYNV
jgi:probable phosphoglycerate mutase